MPALGKSHDQRGMIALLAIILVAGLTLAYGLSVALLNSDQLLISYGWLSRSTATSAVDSCVDNDLAMLRNNSSLSGNVNISLANVNCSSIISGAGNTRTIIASATSSDAFGNNFIIRVNANVNINTDPFTVEQYKDIID